MALTLQDIEARLRAIPGLVAEDRSVRLLDHCVELEWWASCEMQSAQTSWLFPLPSVGDSVIEFIEGAPTVYEWAEYEESVKSSLTAA